MEEEDWGVGGEEEKEILGVVDGWSDVVEGNEDLEYSAAASCGK